MSFAALEGNQYSEALKLTDFALNEGKEVGEETAVIYLTEKPTGNFFGRGRLPRTAGGCAQWLPGVYGFLSACICGR